MTYRKMTEIEIIKYLNDSMNSEFKEEREIAQILLKHHNLELNKLQYIKGGNNKNEETTKRQNYIQC